MHPDSFCVLGGDTYPAVCPSETRIVMLECTHTCLAHGHCAIIPAKLRGWVLTMAHEGHLGIVKLKQRCRDLVWWPGLDEDIEQLVGDFAPCLVSGKTGPPIPTPLGSLPWPTQLWDHIQLDICGELYDVPHNLFFLVVVYDLHSKWPEGTSVGSRPVPSLAF